MIIFPDLTVEFMIVIMAKYPSERKMKKTDWDI